MSKYPSIKHARRRGRVTTSLNAPEKGALKDPDGAEFYWGRAPYRDASTSFWAAGGGNVLYAPALGSGVTEIIRYRDRAVSNAREYDRNNNFIHAGITKRAVNAVGAQLRLQYLPNWAALGVDEESDEAVEFVQSMENHFSLWGEDYRLLCDAQRQGQFGALMLLAAREAFGTEGETLIVCRYDEDRMVRYGGDYATFVEVVSCDRLSTPSDYVETLSGPKIVSGKEIDQYGATIAYHVRTQHPAEPSMKAEPKWARVPRETEWGRPVGIHFFFRSRAGMQRNMPAIIQSLRPIKMLEKFDDHRLQLAVLQTLLSIAIVTPGTTEETLMKLTQATPSGGSNPLTELWDKRFALYDELKLTADGVRIPVLAPGDKIDMETANRAADDDSSFRSSFMRGMATNLNLTYEQFSADYSETTFSSARAAIIDLWRLITVDRILFTQHTALQIFAAFVEEMWLRGEEVGFKWPSSFPDFYDFSNAYTQCEFRGPGMGWVDPEKDVNAAGKRQEQGLTSPTFEASVQGQDFRDNIDQIARDHAYARKKKVAIPGMPEYAKMQNPQPPQPAGGDPETDEGDKNQPPRDSGEAAARERVDQEERK